TTTTTAVPEEDILWGDANCDGKVTVADAVAILQYVANADKFALTEKGKHNADVYNTGDGITSRDALSIQMYDANVIDSLPEN
ncbi:MAG: dockerin type I repeat-containing protein, partial [Ruminococcus sp.]|nr:dockerin type I repeat-containing protein [Ruminococcus sp.]